MKHIIAAIALLTATVPTLAQTQLDPRTQEYRMWSAEKMIERVVIRLGRMQAACNHAVWQAYLPKASEACEKAVMSLYPQLQNIRKIAADGDDVIWANLIDVIHKLERDTEAPLNVAERK
jgi:hypothetical protein